MKRGLANISDGAIAIGIIIFILSLFIIPITSKMIDEGRAYVAGTHAKRVQKAVNLYIKENHTSIANSATATTPFVFGVTQLISAGYLPSGFSTTNGFGSTYQTRVFEPQADKLNSMTYLNGGANISKSLARKIAIGIGSDGGIIEGSEAKGALGGWKMPLSAFGGYNPGEGHVVIAGFYDNGINISDYLYRKAVPGHPELNRMNTALDMGANDINNAKTTTTTTLNAKDVNATNLNATTTRTQGETYTGGWFRTTGDSGWYNEKWGGGFNMTDSTWIRAYNNKSIYTSGEMRAGSLRSDGDVSVAGIIKPEKISVAGATCPAIGAISRDTSGGILSCQSGVWRSPGGKPKLTPYTYTNYNSSFNYFNIGIHDFCTSQYGNENDRDDSWRGVELLSDGSWRITVKDGSETAICLDW